MLKRPSRTKRQQRRRLTATTGVALAALALASTPAFATTFTQQHAETTGKVTSISDGDTVLVDVYGDGTSTPQRIREGGIQAMEKGQCHSYRATAMAASQALGKRVRLSAKSASASNLGRPVRYVDRQASGGYVDTELPLLNAGLALTLPLSGEDGRWFTYMTAEQKAQTERKNLWDPTFCKYGPGQDRPLTMWINYDGDGNDNANPNSEYVRIRNNGSRVLSVSGWRIRTAAQDGFTLPRGTMIQAHHLLTLYVGKGQATSNKFYWGRTAARFPNTDGNNAHGSGAYLFDRDGDVRAYSTYPCLYACNDGRTGRVAMKVLADAPGDDTYNPNGEYVRLSVIGNRSVNLSDTTLWANGNTKEIGGGSVLEPGQHLTFHMGKGHNSQFTRYWGQSRSALRNAGGYMVLRTTNGIRIACTAWGNGHC